MAIITDLGERLAKASRAAGQTVRSTRVALYEAFVTGGDLPEYARLKPSETRPTVYGTNYRGQREAGRPAA